MFVWCAKMFVDSHCHLDFGSLAERREEVLANAREVGVGRFVAIATSMEDFPKVLEIAETHEDVYASVGVHPHEAEKPGETVTADELVKLSAHPKVIGIGETGLDYFYDHAPRDSQERNFRQHIRACLQTGLPLIIHTRDAEDDTMRILREEGAGKSGKLTGVFHCYSSNSELAKFALDIGFSLSFSGMVTFKKSENVREIARMVPLDRLLIETDAPYLAPEPYRGKICEPAYVVHTASHLAAVKGVNMHEIERATTENFFKLFKKAS